MDAHVLGPTPAPVSALNVDDLLQWFEATKATLYDIELGGHVGGVGRGRGGVHGIDGHLDRGHDYN